MKAAAVVMMVNRTTQIDSTDDDFDLTLLWSPILSFLNVLARQRIADLRKHWLQLLKTEKK